MNVQINTAQMYYKDPQTGQYVPVMGIQGPQGETGPQGSKGDKGDKGDPGDDYVITQENIEEIGGMVADSEAVTDVVDEMYKVTYGTDREGIPVPSTDSHYENNAKYYLTLTRQAKKDAEDTVDGAKQEIDDEGAAQVQAVEDKGAEVLESIPADYSAMTEEVAAAAQDVTAQELLAILLQETQLTETMLISIGATFDALPQDETATDIMYSLKLEADRLQLVYENWLEEREGA